MGYVGYDISWTMPQCVLCLRLIGVAIDVYDGGRPKEKLSKNEAAQALTEVPSLLEFFSHSFFVGGYFVGPQFCMKKYQDFIQANIDGGVKESPVPFGLRRLAIGWGYMLFHLIGSGVVRCPIQSSPLTVTSSGQEKSVTVSKCHSNHIILMYEMPFGNCQNCHCNRGVTVTSVTVSGEVCKL